MRTALCVFALCLLVGVRAQVPTEFVAAMFTGDQLTDAQAEMAQGVWNKTVGIRIDGSVADDKLRAAGAGAAANGTDVDFKAALEGAVTRHESGGVQMQVFVPYIDRETGAFLAYYLIQHDGSSPTAARMLGFAAPQPNGTVLLTAVKADDTLLLQLLVCNATSAVSVLMEGVEVWDEGRTQVLDNHLVATYRYEKLPAGAEQVAMGQLLGTDPRNTSHGASLAAHDRTRHGLPTGKGAKGSRRLRLRLV